MSVKRLIDAIRRKGNPTVVGLDPRLEYIPEEITDVCLSEYGQTLEGAAQSVWRFNRALIDGLCDVVPAIKPQAAYYELLGPEGARVLKQTIDYAHEKGLEVIADVKRNDIGSTATAYAEAYLGTTRVGGREIAPYGADSATVNAYLGTDGVEPFLNQCREGEKSLFILVKTSNPSSGEFQNRLLEDKPLYQAVAEQINRWSEDMPLYEGYSPVGAVVGATYPQEQQVLRQLIPHAFFLVPGYGAQGAAAQDIAGAFDRNGLGAIVNSSRGILCAWKKTGKGGADFVEAARAEAVRMRDDIMSVVGRERM